MELPKKYDFKEAEPRILQFWETEKVYQFDPDPNKEFFSIDTPPPTVSGDMHIGHAFSYSQMDFVARYQRMLGKNIFYPFGTDDNGLATERLVEKMKDVKATKMDRQDFIKLCLETLNYIRPDFVQDWKNLGISSDYDIFYSTINDHCRKISQRSFIELYDKGREYQKEAPTIWCPNCQTAIAQVELEDKDFDSTFNDIIFKFEDGKDLIIATTRPELLPACLCVFVHPDDKRYKKYVGKKVKVPLFDYDVPIKTDYKADPEKGSGAVMCCSFGDLTDAEWVAEHDLTPKIVITKDGLMNEKAGKYKGLTIKEARKKIIEDLKKAKLLVKQEPISHPVNVHERCGTEIEFLVTKQWFIKYLDLKERFLEAGAKLNWYPKHMKVRYDNWIKGLKWDWCISRQRFFGVPFPVWYCKKCGEVKVADKDQLPVDPLKDKPSSKCKCGSNDFVPEKDVLDTWATSSLTPQIAAELMMDKGIYDKIYPMTLRPNAHDIITFWLFNTLVKSQLHSNVNPWRDVMISGFALDPHGKKMSKSKGNVVKPQDVIEKYGADALRFWAAGSKLGEDLPYQEKDVITGQKFVTKLWNASRFTLMHMEDYDKEKPKKLEAFDKWLLSKLNTIVKDSTETFNKYEYSRTKHEVEKFFWQVFCDNYLEIAKDRLYNPDQRGENSRKSAQYALYQTLLNVLKLMSPITPYITEEIFQQYFREKEGQKSIHISSWPKYDRKLTNSDLEKVGDKLVEVIAKVRKAKSENNKSLKEPVKVLTLDMVEKEVKPFLGDLKSITKAEKVVFGKEFGVEM